MKISEDMIYVGVTDAEIRLFEGQYVVPEGMTYNSYVILDEKTALLDTVDASATEEWLTKVKDALQGRDLDYLVISHLEPDHSAGIQMIVEAFPNVKLVSNHKVFAFLPQFFAIPDLENRKVVVQEGDTLLLGKHTLQFIMAPMVHWPEVMMEYETTEKILFSADAFGRFGSDLSEEKEWLPEARRYYINIVGKFGVQVQAVLKKAVNLDIQTICPLHGPILTKSLDTYLAKYDAWSRYAPEEEGVLMVCACPHGHTFEAMQECQQMWQEKTKQPVVLMDLTREDMTEAVGQAFRFPKMIVAATTYNGELFPAMDQFLRLLKMKAYQDRKVGFVENGTWAPMAAKHMMELTDTMKNITKVEPVVTIRTKQNEESRIAMQQLIDAMCE